MRHPTDSCSAYVSPPNSGDSGASDVEARARRIRPMDESEFPQRPRGGKPAAVVEQGLTKRDCSTVPELNRRSRRGAHVDLLV